MNNEPISERHRVTLEFYQQLKEPERSEAIANFEEEWTSRVPINLKESIYYGFNWNMSPQEVTYWRNIVWSIQDNTYFTKPFSIEELAEELFPLRDPNNSSVTRLDYDRRDTAVKVYNRLKQLGKIKE